MSKIFLIGSTVLWKNFDDCLCEKGFLTTRFRNIQEAITRIDDNLNLIIVEKEQSANNSFKKFIKSSAKIPKLVISYDYSPKGFTKWLSDPFAYPLYNPSEKELLHFAMQSLRSKNLFTENGRLYKELDVAKKEVDFFQEVGKLLTSNKKLNDILAKIMKRLKDMTSAEAWSVLLTDEETGELVFEKSGGTKQSLKIKKYRLKFGEGIAGWVAQEGLPVIVPDVSSDERFCSKFDKKIHFRTKSLMCVPIKSQGRVVGVLEVVNKITGEPFSNDDLNLLMRLIDQAALTIERTTLYQKMAELVVTDDLTKLFNMRYLNRTIEVELQRSNRYGTSLSLIFIDIDHFKQVNDEHGHLVGSKLLVEMGQIIIKNLRGIDIVARYGGDEFVVVLPQTTPDAATQIAERIRQSVEHNIFLKKDGYTLKMTASFGVASYPESAKTKEELLRLADEAMYRVKYSTRNGVYTITR